MRNERDGRDPRYPPAPPTWEEESDADWEQGLADRIARNAALGRAFVAAGWAVVFAGCAVYAYVQLWGGQ